MARIAFLLLCHRDPEAVIAQARALTACGDRVALHYDRGAPGFARIEAALGDERGIALAPRVRCGWGEWSLVEATLNAARTARAAFPEATHLYLLSGDCRPIASASRAHAELEARGADRIESVDFFTSGWIRTGPHAERLVYRHWFNERRRKRLFDLSMEWQRRLGLDRAVPDGLEMRIGSQWWCLRRETVDRVLAVCRDRPDVLRFFRMTWIPDETFFQTLVAHLVPADEIEQGPPTFLAFTDYGMPATFHDDHHDLLVGQPELFARKIGPEAGGLRTRLDALWGSGRMDVPEVGDGRRRVALVTGQGRIGARFGPRAWDEGGTLGPGRRLTVIASSDRAAARALSTAAGAPGLGFVFEDEAEALPDLGGVERGLEKRLRHRRSFLRLLYDGVGTDRLTICLDPSDLALLRDVAGDRADLRVLLLARRPEPEAIRRTALAEALIGSDTPEDEAAEVVRMLAARAAQSEADLAQEGFERFARLDEAAGDRDIAEALLQSFDLEETAAEELRARWQSHTAAKTRRDGAGTP